MPETVACNLCGRDDTRLLFRLRDYRFWVDDLEWNVVCCRRGGLGYLNPRPTADEVNRYYPAPYFPSVRLRLTATSDNLSTSKGAEDVSWISALPVETF
jgi:hypothetical protein